MRIASQKANIAYLCAFREQVGGGQVGMLLHFKHLDRKRFSPVLICPGDGEVARRAEGLGVRTVFLAWPEFRVLNAYRIAVSVLRLREAFRKESVSLAHADTLELALLAGLASSFSGVRVVFHARVSESGRWWDWLLPPLVDKIICVSKAVALRFRPLFASKTLVIYNGVEPPSGVAGPSRESMGFRAGQTVILYSGQLVESKGLAVLLRAFALVAQKNEAARLLISGRGESALGLKGLADRLGVGEKTVFAGFQEDNSGVRAVADVFVLPALSAEGLPRTILEGMALGRPAVLTPLGGSAETIVDGESGYFVPPGDERALAEKLLLLCSDPALRLALGAAAARRQRKLFDIANTTRAIEEVYEGLLK